jgi:phage tail-like protein
MQQRPLDAGQGDKKFAFKYLFDVQARGIKGGFSKVSGISEEIEVVDMRDGSDPFRVRKIKGTHQGGSVTLERGVLDGATDLIKWFRDVKKAAGAYWAEVVVKLNNLSLDYPVLSVSLQNGWPSKYEVGDLDAKASDIAVESITIVHEGLDYDGILVGEGFTPTSKGIQPGTKQLRAYRPTR